MLTIPYFDIARLVPKLPEFLKTKKKSKAQVKPPVVLKQQVFRNVFVKNLIVQNQLRVRTSSGDFLTVYAEAYDRINSQLIVSDQAEKGILYLEKGDKVEFYSNLTESHEYFSFISKVVKIKIKGIKLTYYMSVPRILKKSRRRVIPRVAVKNHSIIRINDSSFTGQVMDLSLNGIAFSLDGYYPEALAIGENLENCSIDIFQPKINDNISFHCSINIRRFDFYSKPERMTYIAGLYYNENKVQEKKIISYLEVG